METANGRRERYRTPAIMGLMAAGAIINDILKMSAAGAAPHGLPVIPIDERIAATSNEDNGVNRIGSPSPLAR